VQNQAGPLQWYRVKAGDINKYKGAVISSEQCILFNNILNMIPKLKKRGKRAEILG
jgi:hypothetical protein